MAYSKAPLLFCLVMVLSVRPILAQVGSAVIVTAPSFWFALFCGLVLAVALQLILTLLSTTAGLSYGLPALAGKSGTANAGSLKGLGTRLGLWAILTTSLSLFMAAALAMRITGIANDGTGAILGLVIWGLFLLGLTLLESRAIGSALGFLIRSVTGSLRETFQRAGFLAESQPEADRFKTEIRRAVAAEVFRPGVWDQLRTYLGSLKSAYEEPVVMTRDQAQSYARKLGTEASVAAGELTHEGASARHEGSVATKTRPQLNYATIRSDFFKMLHDPKTGTDLLLQRLREIDSETLRSILLEREDLSMEETETILSHIESARDELIAKAQSMEQEVERRYNEVRSKAAAQAGKARKQASVFAAWGAGAAVVSGVASALGGMVGAG